MRYDSQRHHRRSIRLRHYDYTQAGAYFVTVVMQDRQPVLGDVIRGEMVLSAPGQMIETIWREMPQRYPGVDIDAFVVMPNHVHGIIILVGPEPGVGAGPRACPDNPGQPQGVAPTRAMSLADVVHRFKSLTTTKYRVGVTRDGWGPFPGRLWQRNHYEHVIRDEEDLDRIRPIRRRQSRRLGRRSRKPRDRGITRLSNEGGSPAIIAWVASLREASWPSLRFGSMK